MKIQSIDYTEMMKRFKVNLIQIQTYLEEMDLYLFPKLKCCFSTLIPCKSRVNEGEACDKC